MKRRLDGLSSVLMLAAAMALVLVLWWELTCSVSRVGVEHGLSPVASVHIEVPEPEPTPTLEPEGLEPPHIYDPAIPLSAELQVVLYEACAENDVPAALVLGVIEVESCFLADADNGQCYGLMQLNRNYFPDKLSPEDNLRAGIEYLGRLLGQYEDPAAALTAYNAGYDTGRRGYADAVLAAAEWWAAEK